MTISHMSILIPPLNTLLWSSSTASHSQALQFRAITTSPKFTTSGVWPSSKHVSSSSLPLCNIAASKPRNQEFIEGLQNGLPLPTLNWHEIIENNTNDDISNVEATSETIRELVEAIRSMLQSMDDGEISISPYDTAWVAMVGDTHDGSCAPQFPSSLEWIAKNQFQDGSWGDTTFLAHDRILNTLACVVALRSWNMDPDKTEKGILFINENMCKLEDENAEHMPIGFEVAFPSLIEIARKLGIDVQDSPVLQDICAKRNVKLSRIPRDIVHKFPTTLLYSLEGMPDLDWQKLLQFQSEDGSFLFSPASTAFAFQQTKDEKCLKYLATTVEKFGYGVPNVYPVDLFERLWATDRLQRLGVSRYFESETKECLHYVSRYWTSKGISWVRNCEVQDIDCTAMGFRLLRLHGYEVSADVFQQFKTGDQEFFCCGGQSNQAVTGMYNLYRASQVMFPRENVLTEANKFSSKFLREKRANNNLLDKWIITRDLPGEVGYALDVPWYASLPRLGTRFYLEQYGGEDDVWIGKTLYRMRFVNNNAYLELAKLDYNNCQALHQNEWKNIHKWFKKCNLGEFGVNERSVLLAYYLAAATIFEPEKSKQRLAWAKTTILIEIITSHFCRKQFSVEQKRAFVDEFVDAISLNRINGGRYEIRRCLVGTLLEILNQLSLETLLEHNRDIHQQMHHAWIKWLRSWEAEGDMGRGDVELLVHTMNLSGGEFLEEQLLTHPKYQQLSEIANRVCHKLRLLQNVNIRTRDESSFKTDMGGITTIMIESEMQKLVKLVLTKSSDDIDDNTKQTFFAIVRSFYYVAYCDDETINSHIAKVLFETVL